MQRLIAMLAITLFAPAVWAQATLVGMPTEPQAAPPQQQNIISVGTGKYKLGYDGRGKGKYGKPESLSDSPTKEGHGTNTPMANVPPGMSASGITKPAPTNVAPAVSAQTTTTSEPVVKKMRSDSALRSDSTPTTTTTSSTTSSEKTTAAPETKAAAPAPVTSHVLVGGRLVTQ